MKYALFIADDPSPDRGPVSRSRRGAFEADALDRLGRGASSAQSFGSAVLLPLDTGLRDLSMLVGLAEAHQVGHRVLFLDDAPAWVTTPP